MAQQWVLRGPGKQVLKKGEARGHGRVETFKERKTYDFQWVFGRTGVKQAQEVIE